MIPQSRWLTAVLAITLIHTSPAPALALRAAGLEESNEREKLRKALREVAKPVAQIAAARSAVAPADTGSRTSHILLDAARRVAGLPTPIVPHGIQANDRQRRGVAAGMEEAWERDVTVLLDYYEATKERLGFRDAPSSIAIRQALERQNMTANDKKALVESAIHKVLHQQTSPSVLQRLSTLHWSGQPALTRPLYTIILILQHPHSVQGGATSMAFHLIQAYEYFRESARPTSFGAAVPSLEAAVGIFRAARMTLSSLEGDLVRAQVQDAAQAVDRATVPPEELLPLGRYTSLDEARARGAAFQQFQTVLTIVLNKALAVLPAAGLEEAKELALAVTQEMLGVAAPAGATHGLWVPANVLGKPKISIRIIDSRIKADDLPISFLADRVELPSSMWFGLSVIALALDDTEAVFETPPGILVRFSVPGNVKTLDRRALMVLRDANAPGPRPVVVYWHPASATSVEIDGQRGYLFFA